jgi:hypothetical protein
MSLDFVDFLHRELPDLNASRFALVSAHAQEEGLPACHNAHLWYLGFGITAVLAVWCLADFATSTNYDSLTGAGNIGNIGEAAVGPEWLW